MSEPTDSAHPEILREFVAETRENLDQFETAMLEAEKDMAPTAVQLAAMFRSIHSIKGSCGFLGFSRLESLTHAGESLLGALRDRSVSLDTRRVTPLLAMVDELRRLLVAIERDGREPELDVSSTIAALEGATTHGHEPGGGGDASDSGGDASPEEVGLARSGASSGGKVRVDVEILDRLMNLVGELVLARNQVLQASGAATLASSTGPMQRLNLVTTELQEAVVKTRMQPIGNVWGRIPRVVRELAVMTDKKVRLVMEGQDTELDKSVLEAIQDPLIHLVRNAIDHGVEVPSARVAAGKPAEARVVLRAFHEGGMVNIEIVDDGAGIDVQRIRGRAAHLGLRSADQIARLSDRDALRLLFLPGFSTREHVTMVSGRGVGMDVVRANIESIGGSVDVQSTLGVGTAVRIKIPLTLAIIPALIVVSGGTRYAIPQASVVEVVRVEGDQASRTIESVQGAPVLRLRGKLLPLAHLGEELGGAPATTATADSISVVVLKADDRSYGLIVDDILDTEEIVVKPLWKRLKALTHYAGATVMGDGRVALILDSIGLGQHVGLTSDTRHSIETSRPAHDDEASPAASEEMALLCRLGPTGRLAIPLWAVARLEVLPVDRIEDVGGRSVIQYRGEILSLRHVGTFLEERRSSPRPAEGAAPELDAETASVVVLDSQPPLGLVVDGILDTVSVPSLGRSPATRSGIAGTLVVHGRITEVLDVRRILAALGAARSVPSPTAGSAESAPGGAP